MQVPRGQRRCVERPSVNDLALTQLLIQHWRRLFRDPAALFPLTAVAGFDALCEQVAQAFQAQARGAPPPEPFATLQRIPPQPRYGEVGVRSVMLRRMWESIVMHIRTHRVQVNRKRELRADNPNPPLLISDVIAWDLIDQEKEQHIWRQLKEQPAPSLLPELDLASRALLPHYFSLDMVIHDGPNNDGTPDWGAVPTSAKFKEAHREIGRSFYLSGFSHASQSIIRSMERFEEFGMIRVLPVRAEVGFVLETTGLNENKMIRNSFSHNNYWSVEDLRLIGDYRIYLWNKNMREEITYGMFTTFPELTDYELRLRVILTLLVTGVLYDEAEIEQIREQGQDDDDEHVHKETSAEKDKRKRAEQKAHRDKLGEEWKTKHEQRREDRKDEEDGKDEKKDDDGDSYSGLDLLS